MFCSCPINTARQERQYYLSEIKKVSTKIKRAYKRINQETKADANFTCPASLVLTLLETDGFYLTPMPGHSKQQKIDWVNSILNRDFYAEI